LTFDNGYHATNLPDGEVDYIFSSHCLEHINDWVGALDYWGTKLKKGGVIFLYLPDYSQEYWRPWNNKKHINILTPEYLKNYFEDKNFEKVFVSGVDLNNSFIVMVEK
jgi:predicted SAM-dependent methyltransferase